MTTQIASEVPPRQERDSSPAPSPPPSRRWSVEVRVGGYRAVSELLREPPCGPLFVDAKASLRGFGLEVGGALGALREELEHSVPSESLAAWNDSRAVIQLACDNPKDTTRLWAFVAAEVCPDDRRFYELDALACMGDRIVNASQLGHTRLADAAIERRRAFLEHHGLECLGGLAQKLEHDGVALYRHVGRALAALLEVERSEELPPPRSVPLAKCP